MMAMALTVWSGLEGEHHYQWTFITSHGSRIGVRDDEYLDPGSLSGMTDKWLPDQQVSVQTIINVSVLNPLPCKAHPMTDTLAHLFRQIG